LFVERSDDRADENNPVRVIDVFVYALELGAVGFERSLLAATGRSG